MTALGRRTSVVTGILAMVVGATVAAGSATPLEDAQTWPPPECELASDSWTPAVGTVACVVLESALVGGPTPVSYFVPEACVEEGACPVLYNLHGFGGRYTASEGVGTAARPGPWVQALSAAPPVDPEDVDDPWTYGPDTWVPAEQIDLILVAPHGRTVPGGFGPAPDLDSYWMDWNPRYAVEGEDPRYDTPPPQFRSYLLEELLPFVEARFPTVADRAWRAVSGTSLGGFGAYRLGLQHPDVFASAGSVSGALNILFGPAPDDRAQPDLSGLVGVEALPSLQVPAPLGGAPLPPGLDQAEGFAVAFYALGDPGADQAYYRGNMPVDLARNARAHVGGRQLLDLRSFVNDAVTRRPADATDPEGLTRDTAFEAIVLPMNLEQERAFDQFDVEREFALRPGFHANSYWAPFMRGHLEGIREHLVDGATGAPPRQLRFDHRSIGESIEVWGWSLTVERDRVAFTDLSEVSCDGLTLRGVGRVTVEVPPACGTGFEGARVFEVDLGPGGPVAAPTGVDAGARTVTVELERRRSGGPQTTPPGLTR